MLKNVLTVSQLNQATQKLLEGHFPDVWVEGEISNLSRPTSGHLYFSLKDKTAQIRCALFRNRSVSIPLDLKNGLLVQVRARVSLYPDRGDYQLIVSALEMAGDGLLRQAYEQLVRKLKEEGLFEDHLKQTLPFVPSAIGVITSPTGAAIRDILSVLKRRFPSIPVFIYPTQVQGSTAAPEIVRALQIAHQHAHCDVLIVARGGGSLEDLWPFNEERVARAIYESQIPIVTGIGHEIDFTIADFVADKRAATPSAAAELVTPHYLALRQQYGMLENRLIANITRYLHHHAQKIDWLSKRLKHPGHMIQAGFERLKVLTARLQASLLAVLKDKEALFKSACRALESMSPLSTLGRGYAIVSLANSNEIISSVHQAHVNDTLRIRFQDGALYCAVTPPLSQTGEEAKEGVI